MGRIDRLEVENFKSYAGKQVIGPFNEAFSAVIGPNGAGKSNVMDAVCFVLGLPSRSIRADKLKDLIFRVEGQPPKVRRAWAHVAPAPAPPCRAAAAAAADTRLRRAPPSPPRPACRPRPRACGSCT